MIALADSQPIGPNQRGRGVQGQYVYLLVFSYPTPAATERLSLKIPAAFSKAGLKDLVLECHTAAQVDLVEIACCRDLRSNGLSGLAIDVY